MAEMLVEALTPVVCTAPELVATAPSKKVGDGAVTVLAFAKIVAMPVATSVAAAPES